MMTVPDGLVMMRPCAGPGAGGDNGARWGMATAFWRTDLSLPPIERFLASLGPAAQA